MRSPAEIAGLRSRFCDEPLELLRALDGFYECPKSVEGKRLGPLVGYTGRYGPDKLQFVGDVYANFAAAETYPLVMRHYAEYLASLLPLLRAHFEVYCGAPLGGMALANLLALRSGRRYVYAEKKVLALETEGSKEKSKLVFGRHTVLPGERVVIVEDVMNNFSTTGELVELILATGGEVVAIAGLLNRSLSVEDMFEIKGRTIPIIPMVRKPIMEYKQDDPAVVEDIKAGNVVWKPKAEWDRLMAAMADAQK